MAIAEIKEGDYATLNGRTVQFRTGEEVLVKFLGGENIERLWPYDDITDPTPGAITTTVALGLAVEVLDNRALAYDTDDNTEQDQDIGTTRANGTVTTKPLPTPTFPEVVVYENKELLAADLGQTPLSPGTETFEDDPHRFVKITTGTVDGDFGCTIVGTTGLIVNGQVLDIEIEVAIDENKNLTTEWLASTASGTSSAIGVDIVNSKGGFRTYTLKGLTVAGEVGATDLTLLFTGSDTGHSGILWIKSIKIVDTQ